MNDCIKLVRNKLTLFILFLACTLFLQAQETITNTKKTKNGLVVLQINADFNKNNTINLNGLKDCKVYYMDITNANNLNVKVVPTIIIFDGKEKKRIEANIMMKLAVTSKDIQKIVDN